MVATGTFCMNQPSSSSVRMVASPPRAASAISFCPSGLFTATTGIFGLRGRSCEVGLPQIVVQVPQWMSTPGLTAISPMPPHSSIRLVSAGLPKPEHHHDVAADQPLHLLDRARCCRRTTS